MTDIKNCSTNFWDDHEDVFDEEVESTGYSRRRRGCNINIYCRRGCRIFIRCGSDGRFCVDSECDEC